MKICLDPGHGGSDVGAIGAIQDPVVNEADVNLSVAQLVRGALENEGHQVIMTRKQDRTLSLSARADFANRYNADLFVSIHCNSASTKNAKGIETWIYSHSRVGRKLANPVQDSLSAAFPRHVNRGVKEANFSVLRRTHMPAILVELEFINNPRQCKFLSSMKNQQKLAKAICEGLIK